MANILCYIGKGPSQCPIIQVPDIHFTLKRLDDRINSKREAKGSKWVALLDSCLRQNHVITDEQGRGGAVGLLCYVVDLGASSVDFKQDYFTVDGVECILDVNFNC